MRKKLSSSLSPAREGGYADLLGDLTELLAEARRAAGRSLNEVLTATYWEIGRRIVEFEQGGADRAVYGEALLQRLSRDLSAQFGRGFSQENLRLMRLFYLGYRDRIPQTPSGKLPAVSSDRKSQTLSGQFQLPWSHYVRLLALDDAHKRYFYEEEARRGGWSVRQLDRQIDSMLYERVALSRKKGDLLRKAGEGGARATPEEEIKDPYVLEFLGLPEPRSE